MPIDNRIFALARRAPRANRAPVNEYAGLGQGLQQLGQGLNTLITTQWRLHVRNESASLDNWLTEQMGILQIEAVKQSKNPEEQMAHWQAGVKELEKDAVHMYDQDELMQSRWHNIFENKRIPGELRMRQQGIRSVKKTSITEFNAANENTFNAVNDGDISVDDGYAIIQGWLNDARGEVFGLAEFALRSRKVLHTLIKIDAEKNDVAYLGGLSKPGGATAYLPRLLRGKKNAQNRKLALSMATNSFAVRWKKALPAYKIGLAHSLTQAVGGDLGRVRQAFGEEYAEVLKEIAVLNSMPSSSQQDYLDISGRSLDDITATKPELRVEVQTAMKNISTHLDPIVNGLAINSGTRMMQAELVKGIEKMTASLMVNNKVDNVDDALAQALAKLLPYDVREGIVISKKHGYDASQQEELVKKLKDQRWAYLKATALHTAKEGEFLGSTAAAVNLNKTLRWVLIGDVYHLVQRQDGEDKLVDDKKAVYTLESAGL